MRSPGLDGLAAAVATTLAVAAGMPAPAAAEEPDPQGAGAKWLLVPAVNASQSNPKHPTRAAVHLLAAELRQAGVRAYSIDEAKEQFELRGSAPPMTASAADIDQLAKDAQQALYHVASGLPARAKQDVERALTRARSALESLNRETRAAQHLLDTCLYLVRAYLQRNARAEARRQALECRRLVPDIAPEPTMHPPDVIGVLAEAQAELRAGEPVSLRIESEPMGCAAYVNGRNLGATPRELSLLSPGEYRVQAECEAGVMGRVHRVTLERGRVVLKVDTRYDQAIETLFDLSLRYPNADEEARHASDDAVETARVIGASDVVLARVAANGSHGPIVMLERYRVADGRSLASTRLALGVDGTAATDAVKLARKALERRGEPVPPLGASVAETPEEVAPVAVPVAATASEPSTGAGTTPSEDGSGAGLEPADDARRDSDASVLPWVGYVVGGVGLATQAGGWVAYGRLLSLHSDYVTALNAATDPERRTVAESNALRDLDGADDAPPIALGVGAVLATGSVPLWLPEADGMPWWAYASGGVGVALVASGALVLTEAGSCPEDRNGLCTEPPLATDLGPLLLMQAAPFLAVPVVQGLRLLLGDGVEANVALGTDHAMLGIGGYL